MSKYTDGPDRVHDVLRTLPTPVDEETAEYPFVEDPQLVAITWHFWCKFTAWGDVFSQNTAGIMGAFTGGTTGPWWQERSCIRCNRNQRRRVELLEFR